MSDRQYEDLKMWITFQAALVASVASHNLIPSTLWLIYAIVLGVICVHRSTAQRPGVTK